MASLTSPLRSPDEPLRVLLIEDDPSDAAFLRSLLLRAGLGGEHIEVAQTLEKGLAALASPDKRFDIVLLDLGLPDTSGLDGASRIRKDAPQVPIIVLTGSDDDELVMGAASQDVQDYLLKWEFDGASLARAIRYAIERHQLGAQLRAEKDRAESASRAKSEFLANMSHEIRTPMNIVLGMADLLRSAPLSPVHADQLDRLRRAGDHLMDLIEDVLDISRIEAGRLELESAVFRPSELVSSLAEIIRPMANAKGLDLDVKCDPDLPVALLGDARRLRQVLLNLLGNAVKFTQKGRVEITVTRGEDAQEGSLLFIVRDSGPGIPEDRLASVFDQFVQADASIARKHGGAGLGLSIAASLVRLMGGRIWVQSRLGEGATFRVALTLPRAAHPSSGTMRRQTPDMAAIAKRFAEQKTPMRILLIDDSVDNHVLVKAYLGDFPATLRSAQSGEEGVAAFAADTFDVVFVDMHMPGMDGCATVKALRALEQKNYATPTPMIAVSADVLTESMDRARAAGCDGYLAKPLRRAAFLEALWRYERADAMPTTSSTQATPSVETPLDPDLLPILPNFVEHRRNDCTNLARLAVANDFDGISKLAHNMKGTGTAYGFPRLTELGAELERAASAKSCDDISKLREELVRVVGAVAERVDRALAPAKGEASDDDTTARASIGGRSD